MLDIQLKPDTRPGHSIPQLHSTLQQLNTLHQQHSTRHHQPTPHSGRCNCRYMYYSWLFNKCKNVKNSFVAYNVLFSAENLKVSADVCVRSNSTERKAIISMSSRVFTTSIRSFREGNLEGVLVDRGVPERAPVPDSFLSTASAPRHVETCSTWTSLYRDPLRLIDMFKLVH